MLADAVNARLLSPRLHTEERFAGLRIDDDLAGSRIAERLSLVVADDDALDHTRSGDDRRIGAGGELNGRCRDQRIDDVRTLRPRTVLDLGDLHGEVHRRTSPIKP